MNLLMFFFLSLGLSMDAFAVSVSNGMCSRGKGQGTFAIFSCGMFALCQGLMPLLGFLLGHTFSSIVDTLDHWLVCLLLPLIGGKMLYEAIKRKGDPVPTIIATGSRIRLVVLQALAISIDAMSIGLGFGVLGLNLWAACATLASVTLLCSLLGFGAGVYFGGKLQRQAEILGGLVLILIGVKIFVEHLL